MHLRGKIEVDVKIHLTIILHLILSSLTYQMFRSKNFKNFLEKPYVGVFCFNKVYLNRCFPVIFAKFLITFCATPKNGCY